MVEQAGSQIEQASAALEQGTTSVRQTAGDLKEQGKSKLRETLDQRTTQAGEQAQKLAQALRQSGEQLRNEDDGAQVARLTEGAAQRMERFGSYLQGATGDDLLSQAEGFARRRPWMAAGIGLVAGLAASRFLKASAERRYGESMQPASELSPGSPYEMQSARASESFGAAPEPYAETYASG